MVEQTMDKPFDYKTHTLNSGLRLVSVAMPATKSVTVLVLVGTGSKYETKEINGISHFLEHMMFKGTKKRPGPLDISRELDALGAGYNAFTSKEYTGYYAKTSADKLDVALDVISDIFINSKLEEKEINVEKGVIVEEINMYRDNPGRYVGDLFHKLLYGDQPAGWEVAGEKEIVTKLQRSDFVNYFSSHYVAKNTIVAIAGNINHDDVYKKVEQTFSNIRIGETLSKVAVKEEQSEPKMLLHWKETDQAHLILGVRAYNMFDERRYALDLLGTILGGGMSSRLFSEVREKRGLAYYVGSGSVEYTDSGFFSVRAGVNKEKAHEALEVITEEIRKMKSNGITADELQRAKDQARGGLALFLEHSDNIAEAYAEPLLFENRILTPEEKLDKIGKVTAEQVLEVAAEIFKNETLNLALIGPFKEESVFRDILKI